MRVVFDTNTFVSAIAIPGGEAKRALRRVIDSEDHRVVSNDIIRELVDVLGRKFAQDAEELARVAIFVADLGELVEPTRRVGVLSDERDNRVLECALEGAAEVVVTGDREMLKPGKHEGTRIVALREYLQRG